jgi:ABC-2 type transport system ATP-binding protein
MNCIEVKNVTKYFGNICAVKNVNLTFKENKIYGLLGRNGAGKTTLLNIITGRILPNQGEVYVDGEKALENDKAMQRIYMMGEKNYYPQGMKIKDVFKWTKEFYPNFNESYAKALTESFRLDINKKIKTLSTGYSSIFKLITALSTNAPYILLDEPVLGLDANHRDFFYKTLIRKYTENPCTIVISTHLIEEIAEVIEDIVIIKEGEIIKNESCEELMSKGYTASGNAKAIDDFIVGKKVLGTDCLGGLKTVYIHGVLDQNVVPEGIEISKMDLQKLFIQLTNS